MVDVVNKQCIQNGCKKISPTFNIEGESKGLYCKTHKLTGMVDVKNKKCIQIGCKLLGPSFNIDCESKGLYCKTHKLEGMVDVISKRCIETGCKKINPPFNMEGESKGIYCVEHKTPEMVNVISKICIQYGCNTQPVYNIEGQPTGLYCNEHKTPEMIDVMSPRCKTHLCDTQVKNKNYEGYCFRCFIKTFPDKPISRNYKTKEKNVVDNIKSSFPNLVWIGDKQISGGSSKKRPDLLTDLGSCVIDVEIDENRHQHSNYDPDSENKRMMEIFKDVGERPIVFIRFNPDDYTDENGKKITSCWAVNKERKMTVKKSKEKEWLERINVLKTQIQYCIDKKMNKTIEIIELFY